MPTTISLRYQNISVHMLGQQSKVSELVDDLFYSMGKDETIDEVSPYFLGSIVIIKDSTSRLAQIVDGTTAHHNSLLRPCFVYCESYPPIKAARITLNRYVREDSDVFAGVEGAIPALCPEA